MINLGLTLLALKEGTFRVTMLFENPKSRFGVLMCSRGRIATPRRREVLESDSASFWTVMTWQGNVASRHCHFPTSIMLHTSGCYYEADTEPRG